MNSFKDLEKEQEELYQDNLLGIKSSIDNNLGIFSIFTRVLDLYCARMMDYFYKISGGEQDPNS